MRAFVGIGVVVALAACQNVGPNVRIVVAGTSSANSCAAGEGPLSSLAGFERLRLTVRVRRPGSPPVLCDTLVTDLRSPPPLAVSYPQGASVDFFAEAFGTVAGNTVRLASGALTGQTPRRGDRDGAPVLYLIGSESFRCLPQPQIQLSRGRAFHSATVLPNGHVLFVGGLGTSPEGAPEARGESFYVLRSIEIYDPVAQRVFTPVENRAGEPRAFHQAVVMPGGAPDRIQVLLYGGLSTSAPDSPALIANDSPGIDFRFRSVTGAPREVASSELLIYDPIARRVEHQPFDLNPSLGVNPAAYQGGAALAGGTLVAAGGVVYTRDASDVFVERPNPNVDVVRSATSAASAPLGESYFAPAVLALDERRALVVGGNVIGGTPVRLIDTTPTSGPPTVTPIPAGLGALWFPTVTLLSTSPVQMLISGALEHRGTSGGTLQPPQTSFLFVTDVGGQYAVGAVGASGLGLDCGPNRDHLRAVAWSAATPLGAGDRVLVAGGTPRNEFGCNDCEENDNVLTCATHQALVYDVATRVLNPLPAEGASSTPGGLQIARFGHTQIRLPDGSVLVAGGFTRTGRCTNDVNRSCGSALDCQDGTDTCAARATEATVALEIFNPARRGPVAAGVADPDDPVRDDLAARPEPLEREPGAQAHLPGQTQPAISCDLLTR